MKGSIYEFRDYKTYLRSALGARGEKGVRSRLAEAAQCHTAYVSQTLNGHNHFSLEQGERIANFLGLGAEQINFFLLLIQLGRAGTPALRKILEQQVQSAAEEQLVLKNRLEVKKTLSREDQAIFYSSWQYGAVHVLVSVPGCHSEQGIADYLDLPVRRVSEILHFLLSVGLVARKGDRLEIGTSHIHLESDSPMVSKHHTNWRLKGMQSLDQPRGSDLHYSSVITASREDSVRIREILVKAIEEVRAVVRPSPSEEGYCYTIDFYGLRD